MHSSRKLGIVFAILTCVSSAFADNIIGAMVFTGGQGAGRISVVAELFGTYEGSGDWLISDMKGFLTTGTIFHPHVYAITGMVNVGADPNYSYDNLFTNDKPQVGTGLLFSLSNGAHENLWFNDGSGDQWTNGARGYMMTTGENPFVTTQVKGAGLIWATPTPEPATWITLSSGLIGLAGMARRRLFS